MARTIYIVDGHSQIYRAYYAPFRDLTSPAGEPTRATYVFTSMLLNLLERRRPDYIVMALDSPVSTLERREVFADYKATRQAAPEDFAPQEARIVQIVRAMGIPIWQGGGVEADDYLASAARQWAADGTDVVLVSRDKDLDQLLGEHVVMYDPMKDEVLDVAALLAQKGYTPQQAVEIQTLAGDATDNVPGVKGVGVKTAIRLVQQYGSAQAVVDHADELTPKLRENVLAFAPLLERTRRLVQLRGDVELPCELEQCRWRGVDAPRLLPIFEELGFSRLVQQMRDLLATGVPAQAAAPEAARRSGIVEEVATTPAPEDRRDDAEAARESPRRLVPVPRAAAGGPPTTAEQFDYRLVDNAEAFDALLHALRGVTRLAVDTETTDTRPMWGKLCGISLAWEECSGYYLPVLGPMGAPVLDIDRVREGLGPILADPAVEKVGHNLKYDAIVLAQAGMPLGGIAFDTFLAAFVLDAGGSLKLDNVAMGHLNHRCIPISDLIGTGAKAITMDRVPTDAVAVYAAEDAEVSLRLAAVLRRRLEEEGLGELLGQVELPLLSVLAEMEQAGVRIDPQELKRQEIELSKQADVLRDRIMAAAGEVFNPDSPKQLADVLFQKLRLPVVRRTKTGPSTDAAVLERLAVDHELPALVLEYRQLTKLLGTYLRGLTDCIHPVTGRVHCSFNQGGTITGRLSSSEPNLQNIPIRTDVGRRIRAAFVAAAPDQVLLSADYSQIELRILAHFCQDETLLAAFHANQDIHRTVAAEVFGVAPQEVTSEQRARAKTVNFGIVYGQTAFGLSQVLRIGRAEAQDFIDRYRRRFPRIEAFLNECIEQAKARGYVETILKRRRPIADIHSRNVSARAAAERMAINSVVQGSAADLIKLAMVNLHRRLRDERRPSRMLLQIHDELLFEVPAAAVEAEKAVIVEEMEGAMTLSVPLRVDTGVGRNWMEAK